MAGKPNEPPSLPPMTEQDLYVLMRMLVGMTIMGAVEIRIHPCRFPLIFDAMLRYGAIVDPAAMGKIESLADVSIPIEAENPLTGEPLQCLITQWAPCSEPNCEGCKAVVEQGARYPVAPEEQPKLWTPS